MENYTNPANAEVTDVIGEVSIDLAENTILQVGDIIQSGTTVNLANGSELILTFADGSQQRVSNSEGELVKEEIVDTVTTESELNAVEITDIDNLQNEIEAIQELIASGDDVDLPETAAGEVANEGTDFITLNRTGDETLAQAGYDTAEQDNAAPLPANFEADTINEQVPVVDPEPPVAEPEPPVAEPEPPVAEPEPPVAEPEPEPEPPVAEPEPEPPVAEPEPEPPVAEPEPEPPVAEPEPEPPVAEPEPEPPVAEPEPEPPVSDLTDDNEYVEIAEDEVASGSVLTNASSPEAGLKVTSFSVDSDGDGVDETNYPVGVPVTIVDKGTLLLNGDGTYTFTPLPDFNGAVPVVTYLVEDGIGDT
ncbi:retention module-containing protein, partial [Colwellia sp. C2M11]|uniref:retention module-containing protein n=1 Tax=Colwellia sp. C2M11 TaxID=2841566 RepID=UPI001C0A4B4C